MVYDTARALMCRFCYTMHVAVGVWRVVAMRQNNYYYLILGLQSLTIYETWHCFVFRGGQEYDWLSPSTMVYLLNSVPVAWLLHLGLLEQMAEQFNKNTTIQAASNISSNISTTTTMKINTIIVGNQTYRLQFYDPVKSVIAAYKDVEFGRTSENITWVQIVQQLFFLNLIIGRWLLPCGGLSNKELTELLFVFIGVMSDILDLIILLDIQAVILDRQLSICILVAWSSSLLQFMLTLTHNIHRETGTHKQEQINPCCVKDIWAILIEVILQDVPFFIIRIYVFMVKQVFTNTLVFYTLKNALIILLEIYHIIAILTERRQLMDNFYRRIEEWRKERNEMGSERQLL